MTTSTTTTTASPLHHTLKSRNIESPPCHPLDRAAETAAVEKPFVRVSSCVSRGFSPGPRNVRAGFPATSETFYCGLRAPRGRRHTPGALTGNTVRDHCTTSLGPGFDNTRLLYIRIRARVCVSIRVCVYFILYIKIRRTGFDGFEKRRAVCICPDRRLPADHCARLSGKVSLTYAFASVYVYAVCLDMCVCVCVSTTMMMTTTTATGFTLSMRHLHNMRVRSIQ